MKDPPTPAATPEKVEPHTMPVSFVEESIVEAVPSSEHLSRPVSPAPPTILEVDALQPHVKDVAEASQEIQSIPEQAVPSSPVEAVTSTDVVSKNIQAVDDLAPVQSTQPSEETTREDARSTESGFGAIANETKYAEEVNKIPLKDDIIEASDPVPPLAPDTSGLQETVVESLPLSISGPMEESERADTAALNSEPDKKVEGVREFEEAGRVPSEVRIAQISDPAPPLPPSVAALREEPTELPALVDAPTPVELLVESSDARQDSDPSDKQVRRFTDRTQGSEDAGTTQEAETIKEVPIVATLVEDAPKPVEQLKVAESATAEEIPQSGISPPQTEVDAAQLVTAEEPTKIIEVVQQPEDAPTLQVVEEETISKTHLAELSPVEVHPTEATVIEVPPVEVVPIEVVKGVGSLNETLSAPKDAVLIIPEPTTEDLTEAIEAAETVVAEDPPVFTETVEALAPSATVTRLPAAIDPAEVVDSEPVKAAEVATVSETTAPVIPEAIVNEEAPLLAVERELESTAMVPVGVVTQPGIVTVVEDTPVIVTEETPVAEKDAEAIQASDVPEYHLVEEETAATTTNEPLELQFEEAMPPAPSAIPIVVTDVPEADNLDESSEMQLQAIIAGEASNAPSVYATPLAESVSESELFSNLDRAVTVIKAEQAPLVTVQDAHELTVSDPPEPLMVVQEGSAPEVLALPERPMVVQSTSEPEISTLPVSLTVEEDAPAPIDSSLPEPPIVAKEASDPEIAMLPVPLEVTRITPELFAPSIAEPLAEAQDAPELEIVNVPEPLPVVEDAPELEDMTLSEPPAVVLHASEPEVSAVPIPLAVLEGSASPEASSLPVPVAVVEDALGQISAVPVPPAAIRDAPEIVISTSQGNDQEIKEETRQETETVPVSVGPPVAIKIPERMASIIAQESEVESRARLRVRPTQLFTRSSTTKAQKGSPERRREIVSDVPETAAPIVIAETKASSTPERVYMLADRPIVVAENTTFTIVTSSGPAVVVPISVDPDKSPVRVAQQTSFVDIRETLREIFRRNAGNGRKQTAQPRLREKYSILSLGKRKDGTGRRKFVFPRLRTKSSGWFRSK